MRSVSLILIAVNLLCFVPSFSSAFISSFQRIALKAKLRTACDQRDASKILQLADELAKVNPTTDIIQDFSKLDGEWKLEFTTAPTREVPDEESTGVTTYQSIDTSQGMIYNVIDRGLPEKGLKIGVGAEPTRKGRVALDFRTIETFTDSSFPLIPKNITFRFPPRQLIRALAQTTAFVTGKTFDELAFKEIAYFDVIFLDSDLRIQRNSEGNLFVNSKIA